MEVMEEASLHQGHHAHRADKSKTALLQLAETIHETLDEGETATYAFLSDSGAFDNTSHAAVRQALEKKGVAEQTTKIRTTRGTPQTGVCSPLMWSLVVELLSRLTTFDVYCIGYADDIAIIAKVKFAN
ncbi:hypothetical protein Trydic_g18172 [Trypoxylus dichotomus]